MILNTYIKQLIKVKFLSENKNTQKVRIKVAFTFQILLNIFREILEVEKIKLKKKQIHLSEMILKKQLLFSYNE